jgi:hypothetical protein
MYTGDVLDRSTFIIERFREHSKALGYIEHCRAPMITKGDLSLRFVNSTISVPALRLQALDRFRRTGAMGAFGCYFTALGTLTAPDRLHAAHTEMADLLTDALDISPERLCLRVHGRDDDFLDAATSTGLPVEVDGYEAARYRHTFGDPALSGRNSNIAVKTRDGLRDVGNVILVIRDGIPVAIELAMGVNNLLARVIGLPHPVSASLASVAGSARTLMGQDALGASVGLMTEGLRPVARGRGGNLRALAISSGRVHGAF